MMPFTVVLVAQGLVYIRRASFAAETVLPPNCRLKMDLYLKLAELTFQVPLFP